MGQPSSKEARLNKARSDAISTIVKQMKIIHQRGFDEREPAECRPTIYKNVLDSARTLARVVRRVGVAALPDDVAAHAVLLRAESISGSVSTGDGIDSVDTPCSRARSRTPSGTSCACIGRVADEQSTEFCFMDSAGYFFSSIRRIAAPTYVPDKKDALRVRAQHPHVWRRRETLRAQEVDTSFREVRFRSHSVWLVLLLFLRAVRGTPLLRARPPSRRRARGAPVFFRARGGDRESARAALATGAVLVCYQALVPRLRPLATERCIRPRCSLLPSSSDASAE
ncbi:hypothetical protein GGX14DRAFT_593852 [Mycena pura]|uniref:Uncharacterized protein n=1 Tax=Mycena pura TaxID=153505 RepID=A0AAD6Y3M2_9AGAR|nr:hypothetical protein GGX14DRAFT_593852 [Mycena pura]